MKVLANKVWNSSDILRMRRGISSTPRLWIVLTAVYAVFVGALAASGQMEHPKALSVLLAAALSLPFGFAALVGLYVSMVSLA